MLEAGRVLLPRLPAVLERGGHPNPGYVKIRALAIDGRLPAEFVEGRWTYRETDLPAIIAVLFRVESIRNSSSTAGRMAGRELAA